MKLWMGERLEKIWSLNRKGVKGHVCDPKKINVKKFLQGIDVSDEGSSFCNEVLAGSALSSNNNAHNINMPDVAQVDV